MWVAAMNVRQGTFRAWVVLSICWVCFATWTTFGSVTLDFASPVSDRCLDQFGKWPDGAAFDVWEQTGSTPYDWKLPDAELSVEDRAKKQAFGAAWERINICSAAEEAAKPFTQRVAFLINQNLSILQHPLMTTFLPPLALLIGGVLVGWILKGFVGSPQT
jgi:hypothetical protein